MIKLVLLILFFTLCRVQPNLTDKTIIPSRGKIYYENSPATFICKKSQVTWTLNGKYLTRCSCPGTCGIIDSHTTQLNAYCNESEPVLHFKKMNLTDNYKSLKCVNESSWNFRLLVGKKNGDFNPKELFALINNNYTLVCERKNKSQDVIFYDDKKMIGSIDAVNYIENLDEENFVITNDQKNVSLLIKKVALKDDGKIFGCYFTGSHLSLLNLTVNVPVSSVSLHQESKGLLLENEIKSFVCKVDESKPKASFQWFLFENGFERKITQNINIKSKQNGKLWQTTSTLKLTLKRNFKTIKCRARIQEMDWTNSTSLTLEIKYPPPGKPNITVNDSDICVGEAVRIICEWKGGQPSTNLTLTCLSKTKSKLERVTITETVTREMRSQCRCDGNHIAKIDFGTYNLNIQYPPNQVVINQTSYLKKRPSSLICNVSGGSPDAFNYSWSPGNYPQQKEININLTQVADQTFTCTVANKKCNIATVASLPKKIIVENYPIIKTPDQITVVENETKELNCISEGNPKPTNKWRIGNKIINSPLLRISFTRQNQSGGIECIAIANSSKHGILRSGQNISIVVTYPPEIMISYEKTKKEINCSANASPSTITYKLLQKWGNLKKRIIDEKKIVFQNLTYEESGDWICQANNGVPTKTGKKYSEKSVPVKVDTQAKFLGDKIQKAHIGDQKKIKVCFYCHPEAEVVGWYTGNEKLSSDKAVYRPAEDGLFPFTGNCSILTLAITEKSAKNYALRVKNGAGESQYTVTLDIKESDDSMNILVIVIPIAIIVILILVCGGFGFYKYRIYAKEKQSKTNLVDNNNSTNEMIDNSLYAGVTNNAEMIDNSLYAGVTNNAAADIEPLYAQVNKGPKNLSKKKNANVEDLYAQVDKSKKPQNKNASDIEPLYAQVNKGPKKLSKKKNENIEELYAQVDKSKKPQKQNPNVEELYAQVDKSKKPENKNSNIEALYAQVDKSKKPQDKNLLDGNNSLYANVDQLTSDNKVKKKVVKKNPPVPLKPKPKPKPNPDSTKDIYENLEMKQNKTDGNQELMYADLDFLEKGDKKNPKPVKVEETMYAAIDFSEMDNH